MDENLSNHMGSQYLLYHRLDCTGLTNGGTLLFFTFSFKIKEILLLKLWENGKIVKVFMVINYIKLTPTRHGEIISR
jgi:hypothetical protein